jgi:hypothetical protein
MLLRVPLQAADKSPQAVDKAVNNGRYLIRSSSRTALDHPPLFDVFAASCRGPDRVREKVRACRGEKIEWHGSTKNIYERYGL